MVKRFAILAIALSVLIAISWAFKQTQTEQLVTASFLPQCTGAQGFEYIFNGDFGTGTENIFPEGNEIQILPS